MMPIPPQHQIDPAKLPGQIVNPIIDFDSDEPLACLPDSEDGQPCESCQ